jgi:hypothetical protein
VAAAGGAGGGGGRDAEVQEAGAAGVFDEGVDAGVEDLESAG